MEATFIAPDMYPQPQDIEGTFYFWPGIYTSSVVGDGGILYQNVRGDLSIPDLVWDFSVWIFGYEILQIHVLTLYDDKCVWSFTCVSSRAMVYTSPHTDGE